MKLYHLIPKDGTDECYIEVNEENMTAYYWRHSKFAFVMSFEKENNRGWTFHQFTLCSTPLKMFFSRGEYLKIPKEESDF